MTPWGDAEARFVGYGSTGWWRRALAPVLIFVVVAGGMCPALYGSMLPHTHLFVGGPPPSGWEHHEHENPLFALLGAPGGPNAAAQADAEPATAETVSRPREPAAGRVISVYSGATSLVLSVFGYTLITPTPTGLPWPGLSLPVAAPPGRIDPQIWEGPTPPPPRLS